MPIRKPEDIPSGEVTPPEVYWNRRRFVRAAVMAGSVAATAGVYRLLNSRRGPDAATERLANIVQPGNLASSQPSTQASQTPGATPDSPAYDDATLRAFRTDEAQISFEDITHYNNFYEFDTSKDGVAYAARRFVSKPWQVVVDGLCGKPRTFGLEDLLALPQEERVYRMRCVEAWSMVIPWVGFPLSAILNKVEPRSNAKFVKFETLLDPSRMPNQRRAVLDWPYVEGLRMDEAMHPLTILATGIYGNAMPPQNGAPVRLVVPWKYGFKGIKSIVRIRLLEQQPVSTWTNAAPHEYGFYCNVNPQVDHPRWSQASERRIGEFGRRDTLMFNGNAEQVAHLYAGMDLRRNF